MTQIETDGFLSDEAMAGSAIYRERFAGWFEFAENLNRLAVKSLGMAHLKDIDPAKHVIYLLTIRILEQYESIVILVERGILSSAKLIVRPMLEALFTLAALAKDSSFVTEYLGSQRYVDLNALRSSCRWRNKDLMKRFKEHNLESRYIELKDELKNMPVELLKPIHWAKLSDYEDFYHVYYVEYCSSTHSSPSILNEHMDSDGDDVEIAFGPAIDGFGLLFGNASCFLFLAFMHMTSAFDIKVEDEMDRLHTVLQELRSQEE